MTDDRRALAALLLVLEAALALLAALGLLTFARLSNAVGSMAVPEAVAFGGVAVLLILAVGVLRDWRVARIGALIWQVITLMGNALAIATSGGARLSLTLELTGIALPLAIVLLVSGRARTAPDLRRALLAGLLLLAGLIHLGLVPEHLTGSPRLGPLFAIDGVAFIGLAALNWRSTRWRAPAAGLLVATILAYLVVVARNLESVEDLAVATKLIELGALGVILWPTHVRINVRLGAAVGGLLLAVAVSGAVAWTAELRPGQAGHSHDGKVLLAAAPPSDAQRAAAAKLVDDTRAGIDRFADVNAALAAGYRPGTAPDAPTVHYVNEAYKHDGRTLDPERPQALVYANTPTGTLLLGAMYIWPKSDTPAPNIGGSLAEWHTHTNVCFTFGVVIDGLESPYGTCPVGSINVQTPPMLHVWTVPNPGGPFGDLSPAFVAHLTQPTSRG